MKILDTLNPTSTISEEDLRRGFRHLMWAGGYAQIMAVLISGAFLIGFALALGANNAVIGLLAALPPLCQILQIAFVPLVERLRRRKAITVIGLVVNRLLWIPIAFIPMALPEAWRLPALLGGIAVYYAVENLVGCAWSPWLRDLIPEGRRGQYFGRRFSMMTALGAVATLVASGLIVLCEQWIDDLTPVYCALFVLGAGFGLLGIRDLALTPEPVWSELPQGSMLGKLRRPFGDPNFRRHLVFFGVWCFSVNLALPFLVVYLLKRIGTGMGVVLALSFLSQLFNVLFFRIWGVMADQFSNKSVLSVCGFFFVLSLLMIPFLTLPDPHLMTYPLLVLIYALMGVATAGVALCAGNMALKISPPGSATAYLATNAVVAGVGASIAPLLAGLAADWFAAQEMSVSFRWRVVDVGEFSAIALDLRGLDFLFVFGGVLGFYALHRLTLVREVGEVHERVVLEHLYGQVRAFTRHASNLGGMRYFTYFPYWVLRATRHKKRKEEMPAAPPDAPPGAGAPTASEAADAGAVPETPSPDVADDTPRPGPDSLAP